MQPIQISESGIQILLQNFDTNKAQALMEYVSLYLSTVLMS